MESPYEVEIVPAGDLTYLCGLTISTQFEKDKTKYYCKCRGASHSKFIILQQPALIENQNSILSGRQVILRYVYNGTVLGFKTNIIQTIVAPFRLIFVDYPEEIERYSLRTCERADVVIHAQFSIFDKVIRTVMKDLSCNGCRMFVDAVSIEGLVFNVGDQTGLLSFPTDIFEDVLNISCKIVRVRADKERTELGIEFDLSNQDTLDKITQYVDHILNLLA
jgi:hypothetical protein